MDTVIYLLVSTNGQAFDGHGLDVQERQCREYATRAGLEVVSALRDEGLSGTLPVPERPALMDCLTMLRDDLAVVLVIARLDRLARALTTQEVILAEAWKYGSEVHPADTGRVPKDDPDDPMRTAMRQMAGVFAELDRADRQAAERRPQGQGSQGRTPIRLVPVWVLQARTRAE